MTDLFIENYLRSLDLFNRAKSFIQKRKLNIAKLSLEKALILFPSEYIPSDKKELFQLKRNILSTLKLTYKKSWYRRKASFLNIKFAVGNAKSRKYIYLASIIIIVSFFSFSDFLVGKGEKYLKGLLETSNLFLLKKESKNNFGNVVLDSTENVVERQKKLLEKKGIEISNFNVHRKAKFDIIEMDVVYKDDENSNKTNFILEILNAMEYYTNLQSVIINLREKNGILLNSIKIDADICKDYKNDKISSSEFIDKWEIINR